MKVLKFGGTSVGTVESLRSVKNIVESNATPVIVVVSALGGLTDKLIATAKKAASGDDSYLTEMTALRQRHLDIIENVVLPDLKNETCKAINSLLDELQRYYDGVFLLHNLPESTLDIIVSYGERMSSAIIANMIEGATLHDSLKFIKTEKWFSKNIADQKLIPRLIRDEFKGFDGIAIVPGFISTDRDSGAITNLGRGGSDFTAALIAASLDASLLEIWTDVDGFMSADPRVIPSAKVMPYMTFIESMELCNFGAKVIYPPTIYPVFHKNIPIKILNTFNPTAPGTHISEHSSDSEPDTRIKGISTIKNVSLFTFGLKDNPHSEKWQSRSLNALARKGVTVLSITRPEGEASLVMAVSGNEADHVESILTTEFAPELSKGLLNKITRADNLAILAVVGEGMKEKRRLAPRILNTLQRDSIKVAAYSSRPSETTLTFVVDEKDVNDSLRLMHALLF